MDKKYVLITGATSGFGRACAILFAQHGYSIIATGRRKERLDELSKELKSSTVDFIALCFDIQDKLEVQRNLKTLEPIKNQIEILINNAGLAAGRDNFQDALLSDWETMIDTNVKGLMYVSQMVAQWMVVNKKGHIINIGSTAGKEVYPQGNLYCASKHAVDAITKAMRIDLLPHHIKVTAIHPGAAETEFSLVRFKGDGEKANAVYNGFQPLKAEDIANIVYYTTTLPAHVCINDLVVTPTAQANSYIIEKTKN